ncbi:Flippase-like domain-containing protein [Nitrospira tepida]|uniref:Flippase-like domain-containing protein n=1 Tax=Nitrospira tepida TaxID=2973512 RepID=A0AA86MWZ4_9BACT|nr:lysylphosphatidylglycerol synthase transmembrane domain-containing protein [Nitrospira tepida]CAI4030581.1 Flippase-like domain-containing protein [Nitrospira tepida]
MWLKILLLAVGALTLTALVWHIGPARILDAASQVGPFGLLLVLIPSLVMYLLEAYGWKLTMGAYAGAVSFPRLLAIRTAGEVVNMTTPTAYIGGEPLKAYLLKRAQVPLVDGLASVVLAKTFMTIAQVLFILLGLVVAFWLLGSEGSSGQMVMASIVSAGVLAFGVAGFVAVQRWGLFTGALGLLRRANLRVAYLEARESKLQELDRTILNFYGQDRRNFLLSTGLYFGGWLAEALEVYVMLVCLGVPVTALASLAIGALSAFIKGGTFFIPGSLGAQDGGNLLLVTAFGYSDVAGITFALLRRFREIVWIGIGLLCLALLDGRAAVPQGEQPR